MVATHLMGVGARARPDRGRRRSAPPGAASLGQGCVLGATMLVAAAATLAARVPGELRFSSEFYTEAGGVVGAASTAPSTGPRLHRRGAGAGCAVRVGPLLAHRNQPFRRHLRGEKYGREPAHPPARLRESRSARREASASGRDPGVEPLEELAPEPVAPPFEVSDTDPTREFEIVLPVRPETSELRGSGKASTRRHRRRCSASAAGIPSTTSRRPAAGSRGRSRTSGWRRR